VWRLAKKSKVNRSIGQQKHAFSSLSFWVRHLIAPIRWRPVNKLDHHYVHGHNDGHFKRRKSMTTIQASEFKAKCLALMDQVAASGETLIITKNGKPVAELRPYKAPRAKSFIGLTQHLGSITGDVMSPIDVEWDALK